MGGVASLAEASCRRNTFQQAINGSVWLKTYWLSQKGSPNNKKEPYQFLASTRPLNWLAYEATAVTSAEESSTLDSIKRWLPICNSEQDHVLEAADGKAEGDVGLDMMSQRSG